MNILWVVHDVLEQFAQNVKKGEPTYGGSWVTPLFDALMKEDSNVIGVITPVVNGEYLKVSNGKSIFYSIPIKKGDNLKYHRRENVEFYLKAVNDFKPDIIHFHGTEKNFGLLRKFVAPEIPMVGSLQGIINSYLPYLLMSSSEFNRRKYKSVKNWLGRGGIDAFIRKWNFYKKIEKDIFQINQYFIGRTLWDKAQAYSLNENIKYYHGEELLRKAFSDSEWDINKCNKKSIFISSGAYPVKGLHTLIEAVNLLKTRYPEIKVYVPLFGKIGELRLRDYLFGDDYSNYIKTLIKKYNLQTSFIPLNRLNAQEMADRFKQSHVFVISSFIENSPNSLGEAMKIGVPTVVSYTGGIGSMLKDEQSSLFFPIGDFRTLAQQIKRIFESDDLAVKLSKNAQIIAENRHNVISATNQYMDIYSQIIATHNESFTSI